MGRDGQSGLVSVAALKTVTAVRSFFDETVISSSYITIGVYVLAATRIRTVASAMRQVPLATVRVGLAPVGQSRRVADRGQQRRGGYGRWLAWRRGGVGDHDGLVPVVAV